MFASSKSRTISDLRDVALNLFQRALEDCSIERAFEFKVKRTSAADGEELSLLGDDLIRLDKLRHIGVVAVGKAAATMLGALLSRLGGLRQCELRGVLIAAEEPSDLPSKFQFFAGGHPTPNQASMDGAKAAIKLVGSLKRFSHWCRGKQEQRQRRNTEILRCAQDDEISTSSETAPAMSDDILCLFLLSGGASSMMELPLDPVIPLEDTRKFHHELVHSGASIAEINCVRKHFSAVKGGRLALKAEGVPSYSILVSDVPSGQLDVLASGPTLPDLSTVDQCREILARFRLMERFPASVQHFFLSDQLVETPKPGQLSSKVAVLLSAEDVAASVALHASGFGFHAVIDNTCDDWSYNSAAEYLLQRLLELRRTHKRVCLISSGEVTVEVSAGASETDGVGGVKMRGTGGRNQHFALYAATLLKRLDGPVVVLSVGTDGIDGNSFAAGAIIDETTIGDDETRLSQAKDSLRDFDSGSFLLSVDCSIVTGATGNNLRDLRILLAG